MAIRGLEQILKNLDSLQAKKKVARRAALTRIGIKVKADSFDMTPVDEGNLRASAYTEVTADTSVQIGYTSAYAPFVHENMEQSMKGQPRKSGSKKGFYWETGEPKFLDKAVKNNAAFILAELAKAMKV